MGIGSYLEWFIALEDGSILVVDLELKLWHTGGSVFKECWEQWGQTGLNWELTALKDDLGGGDIGDGARSRWDKVVSQLLHSREVSAGKKGLRLNLWLTYLDYSC